MLQFERERECYSTQRTTSAKSKEWREPKKQIEQVLSSWYWFFISYVLCYLHPFYLFISFYAVSFTHRSASLIVDSKMFSVPLFKYKHFHHEVHTHPLASSLSAFISFRLLFCILFESIRICLFIIFSSIFLCVLSHKVHIYSLSQYVRGVWVEWENSQLKHILLDQHKIHIATKKFVHWKMMPMQRCEKKIATAATNTHTITTSTSKQFFSLPQIFTIPPDFSESIYSISCADVSVCARIFACIPYLSNHICCYV